MGKNCALGLEYGLGPYSRPRAQFFPIRTSRPVNNIYIFSHQMETIVFIILQIFYATRAARVGYEMIAGYNLISNKREWSNCFIKNAPKI